MLKIRKLTPRQKAKELIEDFIGLAYGGNSPAEENAKEIALKCARYIKANCEKHESKVYWLDVIHELKSGYGE